VVYEPAGSEGGRSSFSGYEVGGQGVFEMLKEGGVKKSPVYWRLANKRGL
jgi:hypothetical protein